MTIESVSVPTYAGVPGGRTNVYLVDGTDDAGAESDADDEGAVLIDPAAHTASVDSLVADRDVAHVVVTHTHPDHVGAVSTYARELDATVWCRSGRAKRFVQATGIEPDRTCAEGDRIGPTTVVETPGHAIDHVAFAVGEEAVVGDVAFASGSVGIGPSGDMRAYLTTLRRLLARRFTRLYPGHGPPIADPASTLVRLIQHRLDRERRVLESVRTGAVTIDEVVDGAYEKDVSDAAGLATDTVRAHLRKLATEGAIEWDGGRATLP